MDITRYIRYKFESQLSSALEEYSCIPFPYLVPPAINDAPGIKRVISGNFPFLVCHFYCCLLDSYLFKEGGIQRQEEDYYPCPEGVLTFAGAWFPPETILLLSTVYVDQAEVEEEITSIVSETSKRICIDLVARTGRIFHKVLYPSMQEELYRSKTISKLIRFGCMRGVSLISQWEESSNGFEENFGFDLGQKVDIYIKWRSLIIDDLKAVTHLMQRY